METRLWRAINNRRHVSTPRFNTRPLERHRTTQGFPNTPVYANEYTRVCSHLFTCHTVETSDVRRPSYTKKGVKMAFWINHSKKMHDIGISKKNGREEGQIRNMTLELEKCQINKIKCCSYANCINWKKMRLLFLSISILKLYVYSVI